MVETNQLIANPAWNVGSECPHDVGAVAVCHAYPLLAEVHDDRADKNGVAAAFLPPVSSLRDSPASLRRHFGDGSCDVHVRISVYDRHRPLYVSGRRWSV
jgi:hypothetical protein